MSKFGMYVKFSAHPGKRNDLMEILLNAAESMDKVKECEIYIVNSSDTEPDTVWVSEVWSNADAHQKSLTIEETKETIQQARPLIAGVESIRIFPQGGKGIKPGN